jgi:uncharacterized protein (UPF0276 family)
MYNTLSLGFGLGLRPAHLDDILKLRPKLGWFEILSDNYLNQKGLAWEMLQEVRKHYPLVMHGVSLSIGSTDPLDLDYIAKLKALAETTQAKIVSDHICFTGVHGINTHDLLPLPYTEESLRNTVVRIREVQQRLERKIVLENPSTYLEYSDSFIPEWEFIGRMAEEADCGLLLDVNNIYVSCFNHGWDPTTYLKAIPADRVAYMHLAGHSNHDTHIVDTHDAPVQDPVWKLYEKALKFTPCRNIMIERDDHIPALSELMQEVERAEAIADRKKYAFAL